MRPSAVRHPLPSRLRRFLVLGALACATAAAQAEDHPPAPAPAPAPGAGAPAAQPQPLPLRPADQGMPRRPRQTVEVIPVESAEALAAKLQEMVESGTYITAVSAVTANGKPAVVVIGMPQPLPPQRPTMAGQPGRPAQLPGPSGGPGLPPTGPLAPQQGAPPPAAPPQQAPPPPAKQP
jgi:hypothetical protein